MVTQVVLLWVAYFYAPPPEAGLPTLIPVAWVGYALLVGRIVDAVVDPLVGAWSDATRSRWGRRRPFLVLGAVPLALTFALLWFPPVGWSSAALLAYLVVVSSLFFIMFTIYVAPYLALLPEIATETAARVGLATWQAVFNIVGLGIGMVGSGFLIAAYGFRGMGAGLALIALVSFLIPAFTVPERVEADHKPLPSLWQSIRLTLQEPAFVYYVGGQVLFWFGFNAVVIAAPYLVTVVLGGTEADASLLLAATMGVAVLCFPAVTRLTAAQGPKAALQWTMAGLALALLIWGGVGRLPLPGGPMVQGLAVFGVAGFGVAGLFVLPNALVAEITDRDFTRTGMRREAIFFGVQGLLTKTAMGLSSFAVTQFMMAFGFTTESPWGVIWLGPAAAVFVLAGIAVFARYPR